MIEQSYLNYDRLFNCPECRHWIEKWENEQHIDVDSLTLMFYADSQNKNAVNFQLSDLSLCGSDESPITCEIKGTNFSIPLAFQDNATIGEDKKLKISLKPDEYILINVPHFLNDGVQPYYKSTFNLALEDKNRGEIKLNGFGEIFQTIFMLDKYSLFYNTDRYSVDLTISTKGNALTVVHE